MALRAPDIERSEAQRESQKEGRDKGALNSFLLGPECRTNIANSV